MGEINISETNMIDILSSSHSFILPLTRMLNTDWIQYLNVRIEKNALLSGLHSIFSLCCV